MDISKVGYQRVFDQCQLDEHETFEDFRYSPKYAFACAVGVERDTPDYEALAKGFLYDSHLATQFLEVVKPTVGYKDPGKCFTPDTLDCRHIMSLTHLFSEVTDRRLSVVEIGGGFGNWARLAFALPKRIDCDHWTIIDIPAMTKLQQWYLGAVSRGAYSDRLHFITTDEYRNAPIPRRCSNPDVVIGAHSLSELPLEIFEDYYDRIIVNSRYFYYSTHNELPHPALVTAKLTKIQNDFTCVRSMTSEGGHVLNALYRRNTPTPSRI